MLDRELDKPRTNYVSKLLSNLLEYFREVGNVRGLYYRNRRENFDIGKMEAVR